MAKKEAKKDVKKDVNDVNGSFKIDVDDLKLMSRLTTMEGEITSDEDEGRKKSLLFTEFIGEVKKGVTKPDDDGTSEGESNDTKGRITLHMANSTENACAKLVYYLPNKDIISEGKIWCSDTEKLKKWNGKIKMKGDVSISFGNDIFIKSSSVKGKIKNDDFSELEYAKVAKKMLNNLKVDNGNWFFVSSESKNELFTEIEIDIKELLPVSNESALLKQTFYPISVKRIKDDDVEKKDSEGNDIPEDDRNKFSIVFKAQDEDKGDSIEREIKNAKITGKECYGEYSVGIDSFVNNLSGTITIRIGEWSPMVVIYKNGNFEYTMILATLGEEDEEDDYQDWEKDDESDENKDKSEDSDGGTEDEDEDEDAVASSDEETGDKDEKFDAKEFLD